MVFEIAQFEVKDGAEPDFERGMVRAMAFLESAKGCLDCNLNRSVEKPSRYWLVVRWETLESHTVEFAVSGGPDHIGGLVGPFLAAPPRVEHLRAIARNP